MACYSHWAHAAAAAKSLQSCPTLCDPRDGSPPGSTVPGILQARALEWVAISFSNAWKWKVKVKSLDQSCPTPSDPMDCSLPGSSIHGIFQAKVLEWGAIAFPQTTNIRELWQWEWWSKIKPKPVHNHIWAQIHVTKKITKWSIFSLSQLTRVTVSFKMLN